jgi:hypothetical protein
LRRIWKAALVTSIIVFSVSPSFSQKKPKNLENAIAFHAERCGGYGELLEPFEDHWWRYMDVLNAVYRPIHKATGRKFFFPNIFETIGIDNACAFVSENGDRFVVVDPAVWSVDASNLEEMIVYSHEIGHYVCGHTISSFQSDPIAKELEADQFAGAAIRALHDDTEISDYRSIYERFDLKATISAAQKLYGRFLPGKTHPPAQKRVAALQSGYLNGSACVERGVLNNP